MTHRFFVFALGWFAATAAAQWLGVSGIQAQLALAGIPVMLACMILSAKEERDG